jgi:uncharacterized protein (TIGR00369 family)
MTFDKHKLAINFPVADFLGISFNQPSEAVIVVQYRAAPQHRNPMGTLHGGILCDLSDAAMGVAFTTTLGSGESFSTLELKINFLCPVWDTFLTAEAHVLSRGRAVGLVECKVTDEKHGLSPWQHRRAWCSEANPRRIDKESNICRFGEWLSRGLLFPMGRRRFEFQGVTWAKSSAFFTACNSFSNPRRLRVSSAFAPSLFASFGLS